MCGIIGLISKHKSGFYQLDTLVFAQMLIADSVRGVDSTGVFGVRRTGSVEYMKVGAHPFALLTSKQYELWSRQMIQNFDIVVGHNRKATSGEINNKNAHPFVHEHIILVHNGSLYNHKSLADTEVDSHAIAHLLAKKSPDEAIKEINGAFALIWFNVKERKLYAVRNSDRPLCYSDTSDQIVLASEGSMLKWIAERNSKKWEDIKELAPGNLMCIDQESKEITFRTVPLHSVAAYYNNHCGYDDGEYMYLSQSEIEEARQLAAANRVSENVDEDMSVDDKLIIEFVDKYKTGQEISFVPETITEWTMKNPDVKGFHVLGHLVDQPDVHVKATYSDMDDKLKERLEKLIQAASLSGKVEAVMYYPQNKQKLLSVGQVISKGTYRAFNGTHITAKEWIEICQKEKCTGCGTKLKANHLKVTSINRKSTALRLFCPKCVLKHFLALKPEVQENIVKLNGYSPVDFFEHKEENMTGKGSLHGS